MSEGLSKFVEFHSSLHKVKIFKCAVICEIMGSNILIMSKRSNFTMNDFLAQFSRRLLIFQGKLIEIRELYTNKGNRILSQRSSLDRDNYLEYFGDDFINFIDRVKQNSWLIFKYIPHSFSKRKTHRYDSH